MIIILSSSLQVHGIGGGSRKTWSHADDPALYWPKEWLPLEPGFEHVRVHSFGYKSLRDGKGIPLNNIHDFGQKLVAALDKSPELRRDGDVCVLSCPLGNDSSRFLLHKDSYCICCP